MRRSHFSRTAMLAGLASLTGIAHAGIGMSFDLYLTAGDQANIHAIRDNVLVRSWANHTGGREYPIAVSENSVRTAGSSPGEGGAEYTLGGAYNNVDYGSALPQHDAYDGTTDGGSRNWVVDFTTGDVVRTRLDWTDPQVQFNSGFGAFAALGITFDFWGQSLWVSGWGNSIIRNFAMDGTVLGEFDTGHVNMTCLAFDQVTETLWFGDQGQQGTFYAFDRSGNSVGETTVSELANQNTLGGEFTAVPEPATLLSLAFGAALLAIRRRR